MNSKPLHQSKNDSKLLAVRVSRSELSCLEKIEATVDIMRGKNHGYWQARLEIEDD